MDHKLIKKLFYLKGIIVLPSLTSYLIWSNLSYAPDPQYKYRAISVNSLAKESLFLGGSGGHPSPSLPVLLFPLLAEPHSCQAGRRPRGRLPSQQVLYIHLNPGSALASHTQTSASCLLQSQAPNHQGVVLSISLLSSNPTSCCSSSSKFYSIHFEFT
jgi:hypothetical protein